MSNKKRAKKRGSGEKGLVPKLRFPEFNDAWRLLKIGKFLEQVTERLPSGTAVPVYSSSRNGLLPQDAYYGHQLMNQNDYGLVPEGCFVYRHMSDDGLFAFNVNDTGGDIAVSKEYPVFRTIGLAPAFLHAKLNYGMDFKSFALIQKAGGTRTRLYFKRLAEWKTLLPSLAEQRRIGACLTSLDNLIAAESRKLDALKTHKKGLLQQLFPCEGETVPRLRFPEFKDAGEWEEKEVGQVFRVTRGEVLAMPLVSDEQTEDEPYPVYSSQTKNLGLCGYYSQCLYEDAITWTTDGANAGDVNFRGGPFFCTNVCGVLISENGYANPCTAALINNVTRNHVSYVGNPKLMNGVMAKIRVPFPSPEEQQKISEFLCSIDHSITKATQIEAALKLHKQGLIQQLFPIPEEGDE